MPDSNKAQTQPTHPRAGKSNPTSTPATSTQPIQTRAVQTRSRPVPRKKRPDPIRRVWLRWAFLAILLTGFTTLSGVILGYASGLQARQKWEESQGIRSLQEQYELGVQDLSAGRYEVARQRFEFVINQDPSFPGAAEKLAEAMAILFATATSTPPPPTGTPTPTRDLRPVQDLFSQAQGQIANQDWSGAIDTLSSLRKEDPVYQVAQVDGMLYIALRNRGVDKILKEYNLEGGIYDLALAERFGPLDVDAGIARDWARLYLYGSSFWEAYPEQAVYYFGQVAAAAPYLQDASGWTARARYWASLIQWGDQLARQEQWCSAQEKYDLALTIQVDGNLQAAASQAAEKCSPPTETPLPETETPTPTLIPSSTPTFLPGLTDTPPVVPPTQTPTPPAAVSPTPTETPTLPVPSTEVPPTQVTPTETTTPVTDTPTPEVTSEPLPTATPTSPAIDPTATETATLTSTEAGQSLPTETTPVR